MGFKLTLGMHGEAEGFVYGNCTHAMISKVTL